MQNYICSVLDQTGEFSEIDPGHKFSSAGKGSLLQARSEKQIYCIKKPEFSRTQKPEEFLILTHQDGKFPGALLVNKLSEASENGIYLTNVIYRYINSVNDPSTQGPLFRRFIRDEERKPGQVAYRKRAAFQNPLLSHYSHEQKNRFRILRELERVWINAASNFMPTYYQPESTKLDEMLKLYQFNKVYFSGTDKKGIYRSGLRKDIKDPKLIESTKLFSLEPIKRRGTRSSIIGTLEGSIKSKEKIIFPRDKKILLADFLPLPNVNCSDSERVLRHNIGLLAYAQEFGLGNLYKEMIERTGIESEDFTDDNSLVQILNSVLSGKPKEEQKGQLKLREGKTIKVQSNSQPGTYHSIWMTQDLTSEEIDYACSCKGFLFSGRKRTCRHVNELKRLDEFSE